MNITKFLGLSESNELGGLAVANNAVIRDRGAIEPRNGLVPLATAAPNINSPLTMTRDSSTLTLFRGGNGDYRSGGGTLITDSRYGGTTASGKYTAAHSYRNTYMPTDRGLRKLVSNSAVPVGAPGGGLAISGLVVSTGAGSWMASGDWTGYRITVRKKDSAGVEFESAPSGVKLVNNATGGTRYIAVTLHYGSDTEVGDTIRVWRAKAATVEYDPTTFYLAYEHRVTGASPVTFDDLTPDALLGELAYFSSGAEGIARSNQLPPTATAIASHAGSLWLGNLKYAASGRVRYRIQYTGSTVDNGIHITMGNTTAGSTTVASVTSMTGLRVGQLVASPAHPPGTRIASVGGSSITTTAAATSTGAGTLIVTYDTVVITPSVGSAIHLACSSNSFDPELSLAAGASGIGVTASNEFYGVRLGSAVGLATATEREYIFAARDSSITFTLSSSYPAAQMTAMTVETGLEPGTLVWSKQNSTEHFPLTNKKTIGDLNKAIIGLESDGDYLYVFKEDGIWMVQTVGDPSVPTFEQISASHILVDQQFTCRGGSVVYALTNHGLVAIQGSNIKNLSDARIRRSLNEVLSLRVSVNGTQRAYGAVSWDHRNSEVHFQIGNTTVDRVHWVYNTFTDAFTTWTWNGEAAFTSCDSSDYISPVFWYNTPDYEVSEALYASVSPGGAYRYIERHAIATSFVPASPTMTATGNPNEYTFTLSSGSLSVGHSWHNNMGTVFGVVTAVNGSTITTIATDSGISSLPKTCVDAAVEMDILTTPIAADGQLHTWRDVDWTLRDAVHVTGVQLVSSASSKDGEYTHDVPLTPFATAPKSHTANARIGRGYRKTGHVQIGIRTIGNLCSFRIEGVMINEVGSRRKSKETRT